VEISEAVEFVRHNHRGVLAVTRADGKPQMSPVSGRSTGRAGRGEQPGDRVQGAQPAGPAVRGVLRVRRPVLRQPWVQIEGPARIVTLPDAMEQLVDYYRSISGEHPDWDDYRGRDGARPAGADR
jgi:hypothetical protein